MLDPGEQGHEDQVHAGPAAVLPGHRRHQLVVPHVREHRLEHLGVAARLHIQQRQMRADRQHRQRRRAQQHEHRHVLAAKRPPGKRRQDRRAQRAASGDHQRALHPGAELASQQAERRHQRRKQQRRARFARAGIHRKAQRIAPCVLFLRHHAFTSASAAFCLSVFSARHSSAAVSATPTIWNIAAHLRSRIFSPGRPAVYAA